MNIQFIKHNGQRQYAIVPVELYAKLVKNAEMLDDINASLVQDGYFYPIPRKGKIRPNAFFSEYRILQTVDINTHAF